MALVRTTSDTWLPGQTASKSSSFPTTRPGVLFRRSSTAIAFG